MATNKRVFTLRLSDEVFDKSASNSSWHGITASMAVRAGCCCST